MQQCDEYNEQLEELCHAKRLLFAGHRQSAVARIARLKGAKLQLEWRFVHIGGEYASGEYANDNKRYVWQYLVWRGIDVAFESVLTGAVINSNHIEPRRFLEDAGNVVLEWVRDFVEKNDSERRNVKVNTTSNGEFATKDKRANKSIITISEIYWCTDMREWYERSTKPILASLEEFQERDNGWILSRILNLTININKHNSMRAECYFEVPREIIFKKVVTNVHTMDNACFAWSVVALYPLKSHVNRKSSYLH